MNTKLKALLAFLLAVICVLSMVACGGNGDDGSKDATQVMGESGDASSDASADSSSDASENTNVEYTDTDENGNAKRDPNYKCLNYDVMKGIWISQFDIPSMFKSTNEKAFRSSVKRVVKAISEAGLNTIILQVRPNGDSYYPSEVYPASAFVTGSYGNETFKFDCLKIFVEVAHEYDISLHAWINPMRLMSTTEIKNISTDYRIGKWYQENAPYISAEGNNYYLVPGYEETRQLVCDGIAELIQNYNIDAVHIDDYFYPTMKDSFDEAHFRPLEEDYVSRREYRLEMVDKLVAQMYSTVKANAADMPFGISPAGSISNNLNSLYANVRKWCSVKGFCDYIAPQVYWGFDHPNDDSKFAECCNDWQELCTTDDVKLVIGMGLYRAKPPVEAGFEEFEENKDVFKRQLEYIQAMDKNDGFIFYSYTNLFTATGKYQNYLAEERENFLPVVKDFN